MMKSEEETYLTKAEVVKMYKLYEAFDDAVPEETHGAIVMHALARMIASGGIQAYDSDRMTKRHFVALMVENISAHYDELMEDWKEQQNE